MGKLEQYGIKDALEQWQWSVDDLVKNAVSRGAGVLTDTGALAINTGEFTGRSPKDRFIVKDEITEDKVWWGNVNIPFDAQKFDDLYDKVTAYLSGNEIFIHDGYVCADERYELKVRTIAENDWSAFFANNMFLRPTSEKLSNWGNPDWLVINAPGFKADPVVDGTRQSNFAILNFKRKIALIGGTGYTGEIKKGIFSALNFILPTEKDTFPMHCSANVGEVGDTAIFFGLSGTGKTTLSADPNRKLIGDDEHGWTKDDTLFNFEGGCYAKTIDITEENEPDIYRAIKPGALLENIGFKPGTNVPDYTDVRITQNTRVSYPLDHIDNIQPGSIGKNPKNIFFLTYDAFGVLPAISRLTPEQAAYHFISGYTSKVAGTEAGVTAPETTFSACFGAPFMPLHPAKYADMLSEKVRQSGAKVWMINTGLNGSGSRISLKYTRALITAALTGALDDVIFEKTAYFKLEFPTQCEGVPSELLYPKKSWLDEEAYKQKAMALTEAFKKNFEKFESLSSEAILSGGPSL